MLVLPLADALLCVALTEPCWCGSKGLGWWSHLSARMCVGFGGPFSGAQRPICKLGLESFQLYANSLLPDHKNAGTVHHCPRGRSTGRVRSECMRHLSPPHLSSPCVACWLACTSKPHPAQPVYRPQEPVGLGACVMQRT